MLYEPQVDTSAHTINDVSRMSVILNISCISWFVAEDPTITLDNLYKRTYDQWLLGDLAEVSLPCLPDSLFGERTDPFELTGDYVLQLNFVLEICKNN